MSAAIFLDSMQTCLSMEPLRNDLADLGLPADDLELWFARALCDAFVREIAGAFEPFKGALVRSLTAMASSRDKWIEASAAEKVVERFAELPPYPDVRGALELARDRGVPVYVLTNGAEKVNRRAFAGANLDTLLAGIISADEVGHFKPAREVYRQAAARAGASIAESMLVAAHAWDVLGALQAGMMAAYVERTEPLPRELAARVSASRMSLDAVFRDILDAGAARSLRAAR